MGVAGLGGLEPSRLPNAAGRRGRRQRRGGDGVARCGDRCRCGGGPPVVERPAGRARRAAGDVGGGGRKSGCGDGGSCGDGRGGGGCSGEERDAGQA